MSTIKKCNVVMLATNESKLLLGTVNNITNQLIIYNGAYKGKSEVFTPQHLYLLSDEEIKGDDYVYHTSGEFIAKCIKRENSYVFHKTLIAIGLNPAGVEGNNHSYYYKKIIATTDSSLTLCDDHCYTQGTHTHKTLPQSSQQFLEEYVREYNKGNVIKEVMIAFEEVLNNGGKHDGQVCGITMCYSDDHKVKDKCLGWCKSVLKVNPKDNTITIKRVKDSWTREEVISLIKDFRNGIVTVEHPDIEYTNKFIEQNL